MALRVRLASAGSAGFGLVAVLVIVGALFPAVGGTIGKLNLPRGSRSCWVAPTTPRSPAGFAQRSDRSTDRW
jgi:hypothetical protein